MVAFYFRMGKTLISCKKLISDNDCLSDKLLILIHSSKQDQENDEHKLPGCSDIHL